MQVPQDGYFKALCEGLGFVSIGMDREFRVMFWNPEAERQFGVPAAKALGTSFFDYLSEPDVEISRRHAEEVLASGRSVEHEVTYPTANGERQTLVLIFSPVRGESGDVIGLSASMRDISERKRLSRELAEARRISALGRMAGAVAHHFNNILGGMLTSIDYVLTSDSPRELRRTLRLVSQAIGRATRITNQLAAFAESENQMVEWMDLSEIVRRSVEELERVTKARGIQLRSDIEAVVADPFESQRVRSVIGSLAQNAIEAMSPGGVLTITLQTVGERAMIRIQDTGSGIPEDLKQHLFEPFFTTKAATTGSEDEKIGLGLAAVHGMVSEMGGTIRIRSTAGEGTEVTILLPLRRSGREEAGSPVDPGAGQPLASGRGSPDRP